METTKIVGKLTVESNGTIDAVTGSDGLEVINRPMGTGFPMGLVAVHDNSNTGAQASNVKFVPWEAVAGPLGLAIEPGYDGRR